MTSCLNPDCPKPQNPAANKFCQYCGTKLLLRDRYRAIKLIGQGGFGRTFLAVDQDKPGQPPCVIKQFYPQSQGTNSVQKAAMLFAGEAVRLDELGKHPQVPALLAHLEQDSRLYIVQEFIDGQNLAQELAETDVFAESQILAILSDLLKVLEFIHGKQVIHRDIKPENIIRRRSDRLLVLVDFGAAKYATGTSLMNTGTTIGSAGYAAPEQSFGKATFASDIYSLGVTCIHLLTQMQPFDLYDAMESSFAWRDYLLNNPVSDQLASILDKMIQNTLKQRYQSATEVLQDLQKTLGAQSFAWAGTANSSKGWWRTQWSDRIKSFSTQVSTKVSQAMALDWTWFRLHYEDKVHLYAPRGIVADYLTKHSDWFPRCAAPMKVSPLDANSYDLLIGRYGAFKFELEVRIGLELIPPDSSGVYRIGTIRLPNYSPPGYQVDFQGDFILREVPTDCAIRLEVLSKEMPDLPPIITRWEWQLDLEVAIQFPQFIRAMPESMIHNTGDRLLRQIVREVSRRLASRVQADFHHTLGIVPLAEGEGGTQG